MPQPSRWFEDDTAWREYTLAGLDDLGGPLWFYVVIEDRARVTRRESRNTAGETKVTLRLPEALWDDVIDDTRATEVFDAELLAAFTWFADRHGWPESPPYPGHLKPPPRPRRPLGPVTEAVANVDSLLEALDQQPGSGTSIGDPF